MTSIVLACGNALRGDDGVAPYLVHQLYGAISDANAEIVCSHQWLPEQAEDLSLATLAIFIDASVAIPPGAIQVRPVHAEREAAVATSHSLTPPQLMTLARDLFGRAPERAFLVTIGGESFEDGCEFSEPVRMAIPNATKQISGLLLAECVEIR